MELLRKVVSALFSCPVCDQNRYGNDVIAAMDKMGLFENRPPVRVVEIWSTGAQIILQGMLPVVVPGDHILYTNQKYGVTNAYISFEPPIELYEY